MKKYAVSSFIPGSDRYWSFHWPVSGMVLKEEVIKEMNNPENCKVHPLPPMHSDSLHWSDHSNWVVLEIDEADYLESDGFVTFIRGNVISNAPPKETCKFLSGLGLPVPSSLSKMSIEGDWETATTDSWGVSIAGSNSRAESGKYGFSFVKMGTAISGESGIAATTFGGAIAGNRGIAVSGNLNATAGESGIAVASGEFQTATVGDRGLAIAGMLVKAGGKAIAGDGGIAMTQGGGPNGTAQAGEDGLLAMLWNDGRRDRLAIAYVGEEGIKPNTPYMVTDDGVFVQANTS